MFNTFAQLPQLSWTRDGRAGGGIDSINVVAYKAAGHGQQRSGRGGALRRPLRASAPQSLVAYQNGVIGTVGSNTASNDATVKLPANKVPTAHRDDQRQRVRARHGVGHRRR